MTHQCPQGNFSFFSAHLDKKVLHVRFRGNLLEHLADIAKRDMISDFAGQVSRARDVRVVLFNSDFRDAGCEAYEDFFFKKKQSKTNTDNLGLHRLCNILSQFVLGIMGFDRMVIHACQGDVISLFLNASLACDYRIAADNTVFCNPYLDLGMIPMAGGPYFFSKIMGSGKAWEALLLNNHIDAEKALGLGLVDQVVSSSDLDSAALDMAHRFARNHSGTISGLKRLVNFSRRDLKAYFDLEKEAVFKVFNDHDFGKNCRN